MNVVDRVDLGALLLGMASLCEVVLGMFPLTFPDRLGLSAPPFHVPLYESSSS